MNRKGFTLVELLAAVIILGLLTTLAYVSVRSILNRGDESYYKNQEELLLLAGREYFADNRDKLPDEIGDTSTVTLETLVKEKYIDPIKDKNENDCDQKKSNVVAQKITDKDYQYYATLSCGNYTNDKDTIKPIISFTHTATSSETSITVTMKVTDNVKVQSYRYVIEKDGEQYKDSGYNAYTGDVKINLTEQGMYTITGYAIDSSGNTNDRKSDTYSIYKGINCANVKFDSSSSTGKWVNETIDVNITVPSNAYRYEILQSKNGGEYTNIGSYIGSDNRKISLTDDGTHVIRLRVYDEQGNSCEATSGSFNIDKTFPSCGTISGASSSWTNKDREVTVECNDTGGSGCAKNSYKQTFSSYKEGASITIADNAGNTRSCTFNVYIDKTAPTCGTITGASTSWTNQSRTIKVDCNDKGGSGCVENQYSKTYSTYTKTSSLTIADKAGNTKSCSFNVYVDPNYNTKKYPDTNGACTLVGNTKRSYPNGWIVYDGRCNGIRKYMYYQIYSSDGYTLTPCKVNGWGHKACPDHGPGSGYTWVDDSSVASIP